MFVFPPTCNLKQNNFFPTNHESVAMSLYPNMLTPPSSSEDSPQPTYFVASPGSNSFQGPEAYVEVTPDVMEMGQPYIQTAPMRMYVQPGAVNPSPGQAIELYFVEQPVDRFRFRYKSEMAGTHGSLAGINSDRSKKQTYPAVKVKNCNLDSVIVRCSIYQINAQDEMPHAHRLIMKKGKEEVDDPHDIVITAKDNYIATFHGMGIIHTAKKNIVSELMRKKVQLRQEKVAKMEGKKRDLTSKEIMEIKGLAESESKSINLNIVCLRFDAFVQQNGILFSICPPIFSHGINNLKSALTGDLKIVRLDHCVSPANGNKEIFILVERVTKRNIKIRFYEVDDEDRVIWEEWGRFNDMDVHHQYAIVFKTPKYRDQNITKPVQVFIELVRPSDNAHSEPREFRYIPNKHHYRPGQKRPRCSDYSSSEYGSYTMDSDELPEVINNLNIAPNVNNNGDLTSIPSALSDELKKAMSNIGSDEFAELFSRFGPEYNSLLEEYGKDAPGIASKKNQGLKTSVISKHQELVNVKIEVSQEERDNALKVIDELKSFVKVKSSVSHASEIIDYYFLADNKTNALHTSISLNNQENIIFLLKLLAHYKRFDVINVKNDDSKTPLQLAVMAKNLIVIKCLLRCNAKVGVIDNELNSALHLALKQYHINVEMVRLLLNDRDYENVLDFIDLKNEDGDTALFLAIERENIAVVELLLENGANVNVINDKQGFVPLRIAIEKENIKIIKHLLSLPKLDALIEDFTGVDPLKAALKTNNEEMVNLIQKYIDEKGFCISIKDEPEEVSDEEELEIADSNQFVPVEKLKILYENIKGKTPHSLDKVASILDKSGNWAYLAELLGIDHMISSGIICSEKSMSKAVLTYAIETNNDSLWVIREFLESLDEVETIRALDSVVEEMNVINK